MQHLGLRSRSPLQETLIISISSHFRPKPYISFSQSPRRLPKTSSTKPQILSPQNLNLRRLTSRIVDLTRRKRLNQIFEEVEIAKRKYGRVNRIVMNAVMVACVRCKDFDSVLRVFDEMSMPEGCGVDSVTYGILLKGLGEARRIDEAFQILESVEQGSAIGNPK